MRLWFLLVLLLALARGAYCADEDDDGVEKTSWVKTWLSEKFDLDVEELEEKLNSGNAMEAAEAVFNAVYWYGESELSSVLAFYKAKMTLMGIAPRTTYGSIGLVIMIAMFVVAWMPSELRFILSGILFLFGSDVAAVIVLISAMVGACMKRKNEPPHMIYDAENGGRPYMLFPIVMAGGIFWAFCYGRVDLASAVMLTGACTVACVPYLAIRAITHANGPNPWHMAYLVLVLVVGFVTMGVAHYDHVQMLYWKMSHGELGSTLPTETLLDSMRIRDAAIQMVKLHETGLKIESMKEIRDSVYSIDSLINEVSYTRGSGTHKMEMDVSDGGLLQDKSYLRFSGWFLMFLRVAVVSIIATAVTMNGDCGKRFLKIMASHYNLKEQKVGNDVDAKTIVQRVMGELGYGTVTKYILRPRLLSLLMIIEMVGIISYQNGFTIPGVSTLLGTYLLISILLSVKAWMFVVGEDWILSGSNKAAALKLSDAFGAETFDIFNGAVNSQISLLVTPLFFYSAVAGAVGYMENESILHIGYYIATGIASLLLMSVGLKPHQEYMITGLFAAVFCCPLMMILTVFQCKNVRLKLWDG